MYTRLIIFMVAMFSFVSQALSIKAIIFDCDGVLVDTEYLKFQAWQTALKEIDVPFELPDYIPLVGHDGKHNAQHIKDTREIEFNADKLIAHKNTIYKDLQKQGVPPIPVAVQFLKRLITRKHEHGLKLALASSASHDEIRENLKQIGVENAFDVIISGKDDLTEFKDPRGTNKPQPYVYQKCAQMLGIDPKDCLVFEDAEAGVDAALGAGCIVYAVPNRFTSSHDFTGAHKVISSFAGITVEELVNPVQQSSAAQ